MITSESSWTSPPSRPILRAGVVHLWRVWLDQRSESVERLAQSLSKDETDRAARFRFERDRRRYVVRRCCLRVIIGRYLDMDPHKVMIDYGTHGKPHLGGGLGDGTLQFNLAHSRGLALYAFTYRRRVGIDLECLSPIRDAEGIVTRFFSEREKAMWRELPPEHQLEGFYNCWTRKEAYVKAIGRGIAVPLDGFSVSLATGEPAQLLEVEDDPVEASRWTLESLNPDVGYLAALAVEGPPARLSCWHYECVGTGPS